MIKLSKINGPQYIFEVFFEQFGHIFGISANFVTKLLTIS